MTNLPGHVLEELAILVTDYNRDFLKAKQAEQHKKATGELILALLHAHHCSGVEVAGCRVAPRPWSHQSISLQAARALVPEELLSQLIQHSSGIALDVRPLRQ